MAGGDLLISENYHYARIPIDRIVTGLCHIVVTHSTDEDDAVEEYYDNWGTVSTVAITGTADAGSNNTVVTTASSHGFSNGDVVWIDGTTNYEGTWEISSASGSVFTIQTPYNSSQSGNVYLEGANDPPIGAQYSKPYLGVRSVDPDRGGYGLRLGDQDTFLFNVSASCHCAAAIQTGGTTTTSGYAIDDSNTWYTNITHPKCQSFVRSTLLSRHNNAYGMAANFFKSGLETLEHSAATYTAATINAGNIMHNGVYSDEDQKFEKSFSTTDGHSAGALTNNNYFTPVNDILFEAHHRFGVTTNTKGGAPNLYRLDNHDTTFFNLLVKVKLYAFDKDGDRDVTEVSTGVTGGTVVTHFRNRVNIYWQPFGETSEIKFAKTPYTS